MGLGHPPRISVVIFSFNFARYIGDCIESVLAQTLLPCQIVICDDHSTDESWTIISEYREKYPDCIESHRHEQNIGPAANGIFGLQRAHGDLVSWLDGDDCWLPRKLELEWKVLQKHPEARVAYSKVFLVDAKGKRTGVWHNENGPAPPSGDVFVEVFSRRFFNNTRSIFRNHLMYHSALEEVGYLDENLESYWDWDEKIRLSARFPVIYSDQALVEYRQHEGGLSKSHPEKHFRGMVQVYEKHLPLLQQRTKTEEIRVRCNVESVLALQQRHLPPAEQQSYYSARNVYDRNRELLNQLSPYDLLVVKRELAPIFKQLARRAAEEENRKGNAKTALKYWFHFLRHSPQWPDLL
jgi:glycosyltransferase involved in cell wall biosynthesis